MSTITTKQLRENMPQVIRDLKLGKPVRLSYRHRIIGTLQPVQPANKSLRRGSPEAILSTLESIELGSTASEVRESNKTFKEEIHELREQDLE
jgi:hypothetical protein